jgi:hypothetical protein
MDLSTDHLDRLKEVGCVLDTKLLSISKFILRQCRTIVDS